MGMCVPWGTDVLPLQDERCNVLQWLSESGKMVHTLTTASSWFLDFYIHLFGALYHTKIIDSMCVHNLEEHTIMVFYKMGKHSFYYFPSHWSGSPLEGNTSTGIWDRVCKVFESVSHALIFSRTMNFLDRALGRSIPGSAPKSSQFSLSQFLLSLKLNFNYRQNHIIYAINIDCDLRTIQRLCSNNKRLSANLKHHTCSFAKS
jgi:hypothetical protein